MIPVEGQTRRVEVPPELFDFFTYVNQEIRDGEPSATETSDDLLQAEGIYGGLVDPQKRLYEFVIFPQEYPNERWEVRLLADEIDELDGGYKRGWTVKVFPRDPRAAP